MPRFRIATVVAGLSAAGAFVGALTGMGVAAVILVMIDGPSEFLTETDVYRYAASIGGVCGALLAPIASMAFMRHVPLWRLFAETAVGTLIGGVVGLRLTDNLYSAIAIAVVGFLAAGIRLAHAFRRRSPDSSASHTAA